MSQDILIYVFRSPRPHSTASFSSKKVTDVRDILNRDSVLRNIHVEVVQDLTEAQTLTEPIDNQSSITLSPRSGHSDYASFEDIPAHDEKPSSLVINHNLVCLAL